MEEGAAVFRLPGRTSLRGLLSGGSSAALSPSLSGPVVPVLWLGTGQNLRDFEVGKRGLRGLQVSLQVLGGDLATQIERMGHGLRWRFMLEPTHASMIKPAPRYFLPCSSSLC